MWRACKSRAWIRFRCFFRGFRIGILLIILTGILTLWYLNQVGVPGFVSRRIQEKLHARGVDLTFTRLRWRYYRGLVAEHVRVGEATNHVTIAPEFSAQEVELGLNHRALKHFNFVVDALVIHSGKLDFPLPATNGLPRELALDQIATVLRFRPGNRWDLEQMTANFAGAKFSLAGAVTNATAIREWPIFHGTKPGKPGALQQHLREFADTLDQIHFQDTPEVRVVLHGDGRDWQTFHGILVVHAHDAETPWGTLKNGRLVARMLPHDSTNAPPRAIVTLQADRVGTEWASTGDFNLSLQAEADATKTSLVHAQLNVHTLEPATPWAWANSATLHAEWTHSMTNPVPLEGHAELSAAMVQTRTASASSVKLTAGLDHADSEFQPQSDPSWGWWSKLEPYPAHWDCHVRGISAEDQGRKFYVEEAACTGSWRAPELTLTELHSDLYRGQIKLSARLNVASREVTFSGDSDFDVKQLEPLLGSHAREFLDNYSWETPPHVKGGGAVTLPMWGERHVNWHTEVEPTLKLDLDIEAGHAAFRQVPVLSARLHINLNDQKWLVSNLVATRPEGELRLTHRADDRTHHYWFGIHSEIDPHAMTPLLPEAGRKYLQMLELTRMPVIDADIWGQWHHLEQIGMHADVTLTNFTFRGESADRLHTLVDYTNHLVHFNHPRVEKNSGYATVDWLELDLDSHELFLTNGFSTIDPLVIIHPIGPKVSRDMEPYQFLNPPTIRANGLIPLEEGVPADAHFDLDGGPFHWTRFNLAHIKGHLNWVGDHLSLSQINAAFYGGTLTGSAEFDFKRPDGTDFSFDAIATQANLKFLMADVFSPSNHLEGLLNGHLTITNATTADWKSWFGKAEMDLTDGLIWEIPVFGVLSDPLNKVWDGLGTSRASEAHATAIITNSIIFSDDLDIRAPIMRVLYHGTVDFDGRVNAVVEGKPLRDMPLFGHLVSFILTPITKLFEYHVTGTLSKPKLDPVLPPVRILSLPGSMIRGLKSIFTGGSSATNQPPPKFDSPAPPSAPQPAALVDPPK